MAGSRGLFGLALAMSLIAGLSAADSSPDAVLKARGLTKAGTRYLLDEDINLRAALRVERQAKSHLDAELAKRAAIDRQLRSARESELQLYAQVLDLRARAEKVKNIPYRYNELGAQVNQALAQIRDAEAYIADRQKALNELTVPYDEYTAAIVDLSERMERAQKEYERLGSDAQVTSALARLNAEARVPYKLGPSDTFATELQSIRRERQKASSAAIKLELEGGVPVVSVTLNGTLPWKMVLDSGASEVTVTYALAQELGMTPEDSDRSMQIQTADGKITLAKVKALKSVKLGPFTVEDVECVVLPEGMGGSNLLGGTFLSRFVYQLDLNAQELHISQIEAKGKPGLAAVAPKSAEAEPPVAIEARPRPMPPTPGKAGDRPGGAVAAAAGWVRTGDKVERGQCYRILATGLWKDSDGQECGPEGACPKDLLAMLGPQTELTQSQKERYYCGQHPRGALICRIGEENWDFYVSSDCRFLAPVSGPLSFRMNDDDRGNVAAKIGTCAVTVTRIDPEWVRPDGRVEIIARIDTVDWLHLTAQGAYWEWDGHWGKVGMHDGVYPTIINGIYWWPRWNSDKTTEALTVPALWPADPSRVHVVGIEAKRGDVDIARADAHEVVVTFHKHKGPGSSQIGGILALK